MRAFELKKKKKKLLMSSIKKQLIKHEILGVDEDTCTYASIDQYLLTSFPVSVCGALDDTEQVARNWH